ncbi:MAG: bifunctional 5,10-methylene-tetrahydrofolate dehydrogenase/5,10-methylene-tetrahydrofolate cyclohydrolase [Firmicutes bacterium]|nr:bifunctional 5,10-methylene-tetrahydrofolate dehydrogenase/5,10-methylene-tetrahydrofolate cyclohydrolase [Bacillota bacterium]
MALELNGKVLAGCVEAELEERVRGVVDKLGFKPVLATILVGDNPASVTYVKMKAKACERIGLESRIVKLDENTTTDELLAQIKSLNDEKRVCGILLQHPVPKQIDERACFDAIRPDKDVDGVNSLSFGKMAMGEPAYVSATPYGIIRILKHYGIELAGKHAVVVGRSAILGKPVAMLLLHENCTVTICHSKTKNLPEVLRSADIVVGCVGKPNFIQADWLKEGVVLVDAGYNKGNVGDIDLENCKSKSSAYTPVPGGVGPMTINSLLLQTVESAEKLADKK